MQQRRYPRGARWASWGGYGYMTKHFIAAADSQRNISIAKCQSSGRTAAGEPRLTTLFKRLIVVHVVSQFRVKIPDLGINTRF